MATPFPKNFLLALIALALLLNPLHAAPQKNSDPPPTPSVGSVMGSPRVVRGGECEIVLRGIVMPRDSAEFKIHKGPKHGSLEGPVLEGSDSAVYTYRHNGKKGADSDRIDFKIKTGPNKTWGPVNATIAIREPPSRLVLNDDNLDFGFVPIGQTRSAFLKVRNGGGGVLRGSLETGAPWSIDAPLEFEIAEGESIDFRVVFSPDGPGERQGRLDVLAGSDKQPVMLHGEGVYRFDAPERITLEANGVRTGLEIPLTNLTNLELPLSISIPEPLNGDSATILPAKGTGVLKLEVEKRHYLEKVVDVSISDGWATRMVRVLLPPPPALLEWASPGGEVDLGEVPLRHIPRPEFELCNRGATTAMVEIREGEGGLGLAADQAKEFLLRPAESAVIRTIWRLSENPGRVTASLIASHGGLDHPLRAVATVVVPSVVDKSPPGPSAAPSPSPPPVHVLTEAERQELERRRPRDLRYRLASGVSGATAIVEWNYSGPEPALFWLEIKSVERPAVNLANAFEDRLKIPVPEDLPKPETIVKWVSTTSEAHPVRRLEDGTWQASVEGLKSGFHELRLVSRVPSDGPRLDYKPFAVPVGELPPNPLWKWVLGAFGILCLLYILRNKILPARCSGL